MFPDNIDIIKSLDISWTALNTSRLLRSLILLLEII